MISIRAFREAAFEKKCEVITCESDYLTMRAVAGNHYYLYSMPGFFVEVVYSSQVKKVLMINAFADVERLYFYCEEVSLASVTG